MSPDLHKFGTIVVTSLCFLLLSHADQTKFDLVYFYSLFKCLVFLKLPIGILPRWVDYHECTIHQADLAKINNYTSTVKRVYSGVYSGLPIGINSTNIFLVSTNKSSQCHYNNIYFQPCDSRTGAAKISMAIWLARPCRSLLGQFTGYLK